VFIDARSLDQDARIESDICIVGAGAAGLTLAQSFAGTPFRVCLLESGGLAPEAATQALAGGQVSGLRYMPLQSTRLRYFGGTTNHWAGQSVPLSRIDLQKRGWVAHSGWPISIEELGPWYRKALDILELGQAPFGGDYWQASSGYAQLPLAADKLQTLVFRFGPPVRFGQKYRPLVAESSSIQGYLHANVTEVNSTPDGGHVTELSGATLAGNRFTVNAKTFILACGAMENCRLLLASKGSSIQGLGNRNDLVGRYFMEHPNSHAARVLWTDGRFPVLYKPHLQVAEARLKSNLVISESLQRQQRLLNYSAFFLQRNGGGEHPPGLAQQLEAVILRLSALSGRAIGRDPGPDSQLALRLEHLPHPQSRIRLGEQRDALGMPLTHVHWYIGDQEYESYLRFRRLLVMELGRASLARLGLVGYPDKESWRDGLGFQYHHMGGTRMHADPASGVVDRQCKVHGIDNLYIAGSSVFPNSGHANPTITIVALAARLAQHIVDNRP